MAVYSFLTDDDLAYIATCYGITRIIAAQPIAEGVENSNYLLHMQGDDAPTKAIFTIFESRVSSEDLPFFLHLKEHLHRKGIACPQPFYTVSGEITCTLQGKQAAMVSFLDGASVHQPATSHIAQAGEALAKLHHAGADFTLTRANAMNSQGWGALHRKIAARATTAEHRAWLALIEEELAFQQQHPFEHLSRGVIHADFFPNNVFFNEEGKLCGIIDFYFACNDAFAYDLAIVANAWCCDANGAMRMEDYHALLTQYRTVRPLEAAEQQHMPILLRAASLRFLLTRLHDMLYPQPDALVTPHNPYDYVQRLEYFRGLSL